MEESIYTINVKVINKSNNPLPEYATLGSAGMDLRYNGKDEIILKPFERKLISTGLFIQLPLGYEAQIRPRSGLALKHGITVLNSPGTVDSDYRGEVKVLLINLSNEDYTINPNERIAQMVIAKHEIANWDKVLFLDKSDRGDGGYGHTGVK